MAEVRKTRVGELSAHKMQIDWWFSKAEIENLRSPEPSPLYFNGAENWFLTFRLSYRDGPWRFFVEALPQQDDLRRGNSQEPWIRSGTVTWVVQLLPEGSSSPAEIGSSTTSFSASKPDDQVALFTSLQPVLKLADTQKAVGLRCTISSDHYVQSDSSSFAILRQLFDNPETSDTVFVVGDASNEPRYIFGQKTILSTACTYFQDLFESGFSEASSREIFNVDLVNSLGPDFWPDPKETESELVPFREAELSPSSSGEESRSQKKPRIDFGRKTRNTKCKKLHVVKVKETAFRTYHALIAYLHVPSVPFLSIPSNYLVARDALHDDVFDEYKENPEHWFQERFDEISNPPDWSVSPCSCHAMYRLADCYGIGELAHWTLGYIVRSLTVENVAYELFLPLSLDFEAVSEPILEFLVQNWEQVKNTKAFETVLESFSLGELARGKHIMARIFKLMRAPKRGNTGVVAPLA